MDADKLLICSDCGHAAPAKEWLLAFDATGRIYYAECGACHGYGRDKEEKTK